MKNQTTFTTQQAFENALKNINYVNGRYVKVTYQTLSDNGVSKITTSSYRLGVDYNKIKRVQNKRAMQMAMGIETKPRKSQDTFINKYFMQTPNGDLKLRLFPKNNKHTKSHTTYYLNDKPTTKQWLIDNGLLKEKQYSNEEPIMLTIFLKNVLAIG